MGRCFLDTQWKIHAPKYNVQWGYTHIDIIKSELMKINYCLCTCNLLMWMIWHNRCQTDGYREITNVHCTGIVALQEHEVFVSSCVVLTRKFHGLKQAGVELNLFQITTLTSQTFKCDSSDKSCAVCCKIEDAIIKATTNWRSMMF